MYMCIRDVTVGVRGGGEDQTQRIKKRSEIGANFLSFTNTNYIFVCREI